MTLTFLFIEISTKLVIGATESTGDGTAENHVLLVRLTLIVLMSHCTGLGISLDILILTQESLSDFVSVYFMCFLNNVL